MLINFRLYLALKLLIYTTVFCLSVCKLRLLSISLDCYFVFCRPTTVFSDNRKVTMGIYLDLQKAFDTVNHPILIEKLATYGVRRIVYKCLANAKRPCDCRVLCLRLKSSLCSCAHSISDMTSFGCRDQGRDSVCPVL